MTNSELEKLNRELEAEQERLPSIGSKIGYVIDHYNASLEQILRWGEKLDLTEIGVCDFMLDVEKNGKTPEEIVDFIESYSIENEEITREERLNRYKATSNAGFIEDFKKHIDSMREKPSIYTGFQTLDNVLEGGLYEGLYLVGAIPSLGKTTLIMQIADYIARKGQDVIVVSLEMSRFDLMARSVSRYSLMTTKEYNSRFYKSARDISDGRRYANYTEADCKFIEKAFEIYQYTAKNLYVVEGKGEVGIREVRQRVEEHVKVTGRTPIVIIDYVQILAPYDIRMSDKQNIDRTSVELKTLSRDFETSVIAISSFNRSNYNARVTFSAFKESGNLEYDADVVIGLQLEGAGESDFDSTEAKNRVPRKVEAVILKNRGGQTGDIICFDYYPKYNYFEDKGKKEFQ